MNWHLILSLPTTHNNTSLSFFVYACAAHLWPLNLSSSVAQGVQAEVGCLSLINPRLYQLAERFDKRKYFQLTLNCSHILTPPGGGGGGVMAPAPAFLGRSVTASWTHISHSRRGLGFGFAIEKKKKIEILLCAHVTV